MAGGSENRVDFDSDGPPASGPSASFAAGEGSDPVGGERSLLEDVEALIDDGQTYLAAELNYQKTRAAFVADRAKVAVMFGVVGALVGFLALIGLTVGLIISLAPILTPWGASALVVALLALAAVLALRKAAAAWSGLMHAISGDDPAEGKD